MKKTLDLIQTQTNEEDSGSDKQEPTRKTSDLIQTGTNEEEPRSDTDWNQ